MNKQDDFEESEMGYDDKILATLATEDFGIHISIELDENNDVDSLQMNTNLPDKKVVLQILTNILELEGYTVTQGK